VLFLVFPRFSTSAWYICAAILFCKFLDNWRVFCHSRASSAARALIKRDIKVANYQLNTLTGYVPLVACARALKADPIDGEIGNGPIFKLINNSLNSTNYFMHCGNGRPIKIRSTQQHIKITLLRPIVSDEMSQLLTPYQIYRAFK
jgi:hypothetical protein